VLALHTTGDPRLPQELAERAPAGVAVLDAPFSGTAESVAQGRLTLLVGGAEQALRRAAPVFRSYADVVVQLGALGAGRKLKLLNNFLFSAHLALAEEALAAAVGLGLDRQAAARAISSCSGSSYAVAKFAEASPGPLLARLKPYLDKDADLARSTLAAAGLKLPLLDAAVSWGAAPQTDGA
jgi:3-hydroxyisobutyrate dehydrogenase-like beta-hydroxyacid dehydrogenase